ncbi:hypothetical protein [Anaerotignum propionicum]|nr:hypothetical protein [Anaerotignum propionicum]MCQ4936756.1 hypothetical protein [Anaerotignum propionicum]
MEKHLPHYNGRRVGPSIVKSVGNHWSMIDRYVIQDNWGMEMC